MKVEIGSRILTRHSGNGKVMPCIVTEVWTGDGSDTRNGPVTVNATQFTGSGPTYGLSSIQVHDTQLEAEAANGMNGAWPFEGDR